ncbi:MAG TPA: hypothetical protein DCY10_00100, partial [Clostridiales bacterium]|nr:hypothetical protein [Clostridiales bacterium]
FLHSFNLSDAMHWVADHIAYFKHRQRSFHKNYHTIQMILYHFHKHEVNKISYNTTPMMAVSTKKFCFFSALFR